MKKGLRVVSLANLLPGLGGGHPNIRTRICRAWRLKLCVRSSLFQPSRRCVPASLAAEKNAGIRVAGDSIPDRPEPALRQARLAIGSSPADPARLASSVCQIGVPGFLRSVSDSALRPNLSAQRFSWLSLPLALRRGSVSEPSPQFQLLPCGSSQPALRVRIFDGVIFRKPPPRVQVLRGPFRPGHSPLRASAPTVRSKSPWITCRSAINCEPVFSRFPSGPSDSSLAVETGCSGPRTFSRMFDPPSRSLGTRVRFYSVSEIRSRTIFALFSIDRKII